MPGGDGLGSFGLNYEETAILCEGMEARRARIPPEERCKKCEGNGMIQVGCAISHGIYSLCIACLGTGKKQKKEAGP